VFSISLFFIVFFACFYSNWKMTKKRNIQINRNTKELLVPGSWLNLVLFLVIFTSKYYLGYQNSKSPSYLLTDEAKVVTMLSSGVSLGMVGGRLTNYLYRFSVGAQS
jgi:hypothetical protein